MSEMAPVHGRSPAYRNERHGSSPQNAGRNRKGLTGKIATTNSSHVTAEDGTPSPGDPISSTAGSFFAVADTSVVSESMSGPSADGTGHRRHGSKCASISSGFAGVAGVGAGGIEGGGIHSAASRRSNAGSRAGNQAGSQAGSTRYQSMSRSRSPSATLKASSDEIPEEPSQGAIGTSGRVSRAVVSNLKAGVRRMSSRGERVSNNTDLSPATHGKSIEHARASRTGFSRLLVAKDSVDEITTGSTTAPPTSAGGRTSEAEIRRAWGLRQPTLESDDSELSGPMATEASDNKANPGGVSGSRRGWGFTPALQQGAPSKSAAAAPVDGGVKRYSWARERPPCTSDFDAQADTSERRRDWMVASEDRSSMGDDEVMARNTILNSRVGAASSRYGNGWGMPGSQRRPIPGSSLTGIRAAWGVSMGGSQDDMACPSPATINAIQNSGVGAVYSRGIVEDDEYSESEAEDVDPRLVRHGVIPGNQPRPVGNALIGIRAAWGTSMGGSQDDMVCPSAAEINAIRNSGESAGSAWHNIAEEDGSESEIEFVDPRSRVPGDTGKRLRSAAGGTLAGIRAAWGTSMDSSQEFDAALSPPTTNVTHSRGDDNRGGGPGRGPPTSAGIRGRWDASSVKNDNGNVIPSHRPNKVTPAKARHSKSERRAAGGGRGSVGRGTGAGSGGGREGSGRSRRPPSGRGERGSAGGQGHASRRGDRNGRGESGGARGAAAGTREGTGRSRDVSRRRSLGETSGSR